MFTWMTFWSPARMWPHLIVSSKDYKVCRLRILAKWESLLGCEWCFNEDGGYLLDQEEAVTDLLREHRLSDANSTLAPIGSDFYEVHPSDGVLLDVKGKNALPTV